MNNGVKKKITWMYVSIGMLSIVVIVSSLILYKHSRKVQETNVMTNPQDFEGNEVLNVMINPQDYY